MNMTLAAVVLLLLVATSSGGRAARSQEDCITKCNGNNDGVFKLGSSYTYKHQGESTIQIANGTYDSTGLMVKSKVTITAISKCQMKLTMTDVEVFDKSSSEGTQFKTSPFAKEAKAILEQNDVLFTRSNDDVTSVCVNKDEPIWSANMKKSIIDMVANTGNDNIEWFEKETRHGTCVVKKSITEDNTKTLRYDIKSCYSAATQSLFTDLAEAVVLDMSEVQCKYAYQSSKDPQYVHCTEDYNTAPMRQNGNQIKVRVTTRLERIQARPANPSYITKDLVKTELRMKTDTEENKESHYSDAKETIKLLCEQQASEKKSEIPRTFMTLVNQMKKLSSSQMKEIYGTVQKNDICPNQKEGMKTIFYDAVGFVNTPAATSVMVDLIKNKQISDIDQTVWFTSLSFMKSTPTIEMIKDLETLLPKDNVNKQMYLGISAVTHLYCKNNYESCLMDPTIRSILSYFLTPLGQDCSDGKTSEQLSNIQLSLKSLGNLKLFNEDVVGILSRCVATKSNPIAIRVSALEVMKHMDCSKDRSVAMGILQDNENDSELRINAYLTIMGCPDINTMFSVRKILQKEKVNQVGSFIWTHLTNIQESNDIMKQDIQKLLNDVKLKNEFDLSKLKFSRNIEKTFSYDRFGMTVDSNVIFSEKSFIPRSLSVNTTATVLGRSTNFIEMSTRVEGLDDLLFKLLGPEGYLKKKETTNTAEDNMKLIKMLEEVNGNVNLKLFGQQISFVELIRGSLSSVRKYNIIEELLRLGQGQSMDFKKNLVLLDNVATIPTGLGFPLKLKLQGSASISLNIKSKLDITGLMSWPISLNVENNIAPSVMSELSSELIIETPFADYGMRLSLKSGTDTEFNALITAKNNEDFLVKFDTPKKKQEIITVSGKSFVIYRNKEIEQLTKQIQNFELCSTEIVNRILGLNVCVNTQSVDLKTRETALLYGPFSGSISITKSDTQTGYFLRGLFKNVPFISETGKVYNSKFLTLEFDSPLSKLYYRRFAVDFALDFKEQVVKLELEIPWKQALVKASYKLTSEHKKVLLLFEVDRTAIFHTAMEHKSSLTDALRTEDGGVTFRFMNLKPFETSWKFFGKKGEWVLKFLSRGIFKDDNQLSMTIKEVKSVRELALSNKYELSGFYSSYFGNGKISGIANSNYYGYRWDITVKHQSKENPKDVYMIKYSHKSEDKSSKSLLKCFHTSTISYGRNAENFVKFKISNEFSKRHIRTIIKTNYGLNEANDMKTTGEMDLELYGGYTWKDDNVLYQEGSLTFKFPAKAIHYEGRYNSEVGKRLFKLSLVLDENQTSKLNLNINYLRPKLYLKDTEFKLSLTIPGHSTLVNWDLTEVDVNKYKYSFNGKYNNYPLKMEGVQTEISKLKYDSSVRIFMPKVRQWPETINIDLRVDFVNPAKSRLSGKIEIPNTVHKYTMDIKLSTMPQNFLRLPTTDTTSVFKYTVEIANKHRSLKSESTFICNPEEVRFYQNLAWNSPQLKEQQITFDFHTSHKSPTYKHYENRALISLSYPGNSHSIGFKSNFKFTELEAQIDVVWNKNQKISILTKYEIENNWTEMGLNAEINVKTPFRGLESTRLAINALGQLRYRKINIEFNWAGNKKIIYDIVVIPRSSNDFTLTSKLVTPFKRWNLISIQVVHITTLNSIKSEASLELGATRRYILKFEGINNSEGKKRDFKSNFQIESGIFPPIKMSFLHKDDKVHFNSLFNVIWGKTESIDIKNQFSVTFEDNELITNGNVKLLSTVEAIKQLKATWSMENKESTFMNSVQFLYKNKNVFHSSIKGYFEKIGESFKLDFDGFMKIWESAPLKVKNVLSFTGRFSLVNSLSLTKDTLAVYSHSISMTANEIVVKMLILDTEFKTLEFYAFRESKDRTEIKTYWLKFGEKYIYKNVMKIINLGEIDGKFETEILEEFYTDYADIKTQTMTAKILTDYRGYFSIKSETMSLSSFLYKSDIEVSIKKDKTQIKGRLETKWDQLSLVDFEYETVPMGETGFTNKVVFNFNNIFKANSNVLINVPKIDIGIAFNYLNLARYFKLKYDRQIMGYDQLLEFNLFGAPVKVATSIEERGGTAFHVTFELNPLNSINVVGRFNRKSHVFDVIFKSDWWTPTSEVIKLTYSQNKGVFLASVNSENLISTTLKFNLNDLKKVYYDFRIHGYQSKAIADIKFDYEGGINSLKHLNEIKVVLRDAKFQLVNKFERVAWSYLLLESKLDTTYRRLPNYKVGLEYKQRPSNSDVDLKFFVNERFVTLTTRLMFTPTWKSTLKVETSFQVLKEIVFDIRHKQNRELSQVTHNCDISIESNERKFQLKNKVEWNTWDYIWIESSLVARTSRDTYFIKPKSIKITHMFVKNVLKEVLEINASDDINFRGNFELEIPTPRIEFNVDLEKRFKMGFIIDLGNSEKNYVKLSLERNMKRLLNVEVELERKGKESLLAMKVEEQRTHSAEIKYQQKDGFIREVRLWVKSTALSESIEVSVDYDVSKREGSLQMRGLGTDTLTINGKVLSNSAFTKVKYGKILGDFDYFMSDTKFKLNVNVEATHKIGLSVDKSSTTLDIKILGNDNIVNLSGVFGQHVELATKILDRVMTVKVKAISMDPYKFEVNGKSNFQSWATFTGEVYFVNGPKNTEISSRFSREDNDIYKITIRNQDETFHLKYDSIFDLMKSGMLTVVYGSNGKKPSITLTIETVDKKNLKLDFVIDQASLDGKITSSFDWMKEVTVKGKLARSNEKVEGSFYVNHNRLTEPLKGKLSYKVGLTSWEINIETPLSKPLDKLSFLKRKENDKTTVELRDRENVICMGSWKYSQNMNGQLTVEINVPKQIIDLQVSLTALANTQEIPYSLTVTVKSNAIEETIVKLTINPVESSFAITVTNPSKQGSISLKISDGKTSLISEYNGKTTSLELVHEITSAFVFNGKIKLSSDMYPASPMNFELSCNHRIELPDRFLWNLQTKWNDKTAFALAIDWTMRNRLTFDLKSKFILAPFEKEYKSTFEVASSDGVEYVLKYLPIGGSEADSIYIKFVTRLEDLQLTVTTPFKPLRSMKINIRTQFHARTIKQTVSLKSNYVGDLEIITEHEQLSQFECITTTQITSPFKYADIRMKLQLRYKRNDFKAVLDVDLDKKQYQMILEKTVPRFEMKIKSPLEEMRNVEMLLEQDANSYKFSGIYNEYYVTVDGKLGRNDASMVIKTSSDLLKIATFSIVRSFDNTGQKIFKLVLEKENEIVKITTSTKLKTHKLTFENTLVPFLPKDLVGNLKYTQNPVNIVLEVTKDSKPLINVVWNNKEIMLNTKMELTEFKIQLTQKRFELIVLNSKLFSVLVNLKSNEQIEIAAMMYETQYSSVLTFSNKEERFMAKLTAHKNSLDSLLNFYVDLQSDDRTFDSELTVLKKSIFKLKLSDKTTKSRKLSSELRVLSFTGIFDLDYLNEINLFHYKLFWNVRMDDNQMCLGSLSTTIKPSVPINFSVNFNARSGEYVLSLSETDLQEYKVKVTTPYKNINLEVDFVAAYKPETGEYRMGSRLKNDMIGELDMKVDGELSKDPQLKLKFRANQLSLKFVSKITTSLAGEVSAASTVKINDLEDITVAMKFENKDKIKVIFKLKAPFRMLREVSIDKTLWINSGLDHEVKVILEYRGLVNVKYVGGHVISFVKRIIKFNGNLKTDEMKIFSIQMHGSKTNETIDHVFIVDFKERRFGYKVKGSFTPRFEGLSEIYTPFHDAGVLLLQAKQRKNGIKFQAGKNNAEMAAFEYTSDTDVTFVRITPPTKFGKPLAAKYRLKRSRRSVGNDFQSDINYGGERVLSFDGKTNSDKKKDMMTFRVSSPMFSKKSAELKLMRQRENGITKFDHRLTIRDIVNSIYRIVGDYFIQDSRNFKYAVDVHHPYSGPLHFSLGHNIKENTHNSNLLIKNGNDIFFMHNGKLVFEVKKVNGEFEIKVPRRHLKMDFFHSGDLENFEQSLTTMYNSEPYVSYKANIVPEQKSIVEINLPIFDKKKLTLIFDKQERKAGVMLHVNSKEYNLELIDKDGQIKAMVQVDNTLVTSLKIGYASKPLSIQATYLKQYLKVQVMLKESLIVIKSDSSSRILKSTHVRLSKNKILIEATSNEQPLMFSLEYHFIPNNFFVAMETSWKRLSKVDLYVTPTEIKMNLNEYYNIIRYVLGSNSVMIDFKNNFFPLKTLTFNAALNKERNKADSKVEINDFVANFGLRRTDDDVTFTVSNNRWYPRTILVEMSKKIANGGYLWQMRLNTEKVDIVTSKAQISGDKYSMEIKTRNSLNAVLTFDKGKNEVFVSVKDGARFFNGNGRMQQTSEGESRTFALDVNINSSSVYVPKSVAQLRYASTTSDISATFSGSVNTDKVVLKGRLTKSKFELLMSRNTESYKLDAALLSPNEARAEFSSPYEKGSVSVKKAKTEYTFEMLYNNRAILEVMVDQNVNLATSFVHKSSIKYYGYNVWNFICKTDFKILEIKMERPSLFEILLRNDKNERGRIMSVWAKYQAIERGMSITFNLAPASRLFEISLENTKHVVTFLQQNEPQSKMKWYASLLNKLTKHDWNITVKTRTNEELEFLWSTPTKKNGIKFHQIIKNGVKIFLDIDVFEQVKLMMKRNEKSDTLSGEITFLGKRLARIESNSNQVKAVFNEDGPEDKRINLEWMTATQGTWKKDYVSTRRLVVKQKRLNIDVDIEQQFKVESSMIAMISKGKYQTINGAIRTMEVAALLDYSATDSVTLEMRNPIMPMKVILRRSQPDESSLRYDMETTLNIDDKVTAYFEISTGHKLGFTARVNHNPKNSKDFLEIHGKYLDDRQMEVRIFTQTDKRMTNYFLVQLRLLNEHNLEMTYIFRPDSMMQLTQQSRFISRYASEMIGDYLQTRSKSIIKEIRDRYIQMENLSSGSKVIIDEIRKFANMMNKETDSFFVEIKRMFYNNEFFLANIKRIIEKAFWYSYEIVDYVIYQTQMMFNSLDFGRIFTWICRFNSDVARMALRIAKTVTDPIKNLVIANIDRYFPRLCSYVVENLQSVMNLIRDANAFMHGYMVNLRIVRKIFVLSEAYRLTVQLKQFMIDAFGSIATGSLDFMYQEKGIKDMYNNIIYKLEFYSGIIMKNLNDVLSGVDEKLYMVTGDRYCAKVREILSDLSKYAISQLKNENNQKMVRKLIMSSIEDSYFKINLEIQTFIKDIIIPKYVMIERNGDRDEISYTITMTSPIPLNDIRSIPDFSYVQKRVEKIKGIVNLIKKLSRDRFLSGTQFLQFLRWFTPQISFGFGQSLIPDFESYATILRSSVVTFDKKSLQLKSDACQVILAKDIKFKKWEIVLEQTSNGRMYSLAVGKDKVTISMKDSKVTLNGKPVELPLTIGSTKIIAFGSVLKLKDDILGLTMTVDPINDMFTVGVSGWYHGNLRGLFGSADNEQYNDMMNDNGKMLKSSKFLETYNNGGQSCKLVQKKSTKVKENKKCPFLRKVACKFLFKCPFSPMASCFGKVDPDRFYKSCLSNSEEFDIQMDQHVCQTVRDYQSQCTLAGVNIKVPVPCRKCDVDGENSIYINEFRKTKIKEKVADIVFVLDEGNCLKNIGTQLENIVYKIHENLEKKTITSIRFGLVAFRGDGINEAHTHTINGKLFGSKEEMQTIIKSLQSTEQNVDDISGAIKLAASYPFRKHASKHIILVGCNRCGESSSRYETIRGILENNAIQFSALMDYNFQVKDGDSKKTIFGIDSKNIYTTIAWRGESVTDVSRPDKDFCFHLAMTRNGLVFNINFLTKKNEAAQRRFVESFATQISLTAAPARTTMCRCNDDGEYNCVPLDTHAIFPIKQVKP